MLLKFPKFLAAAPPPLVVCKDVCGSPRPRRLNKFNVGADTDTLIRVVCSPGKCAPRPIITQYRLLQQCEWRRPAATTAAVNIPILTKAAPETVLQMMIMMMMMMVMMMIMMVMMTLTMMLVVAVGQLGMPYFNFGTSAATLITVGLCCDRSDNSLV